MPESDDIFADGARSGCGVAWGQLNRRGLRLDVENICIYIYRGGHVHASLFP
jgi:hypothetical protein